MLQRLITFLRATLSASQRTTHPLGEEFSRAGDYLALMQVRMGPRLQIELQLPPELADTPVPPLLVQPLLENAIQHGLEPKREGGLLSLRAQLDGDRIIITVHDTGQGLVASKAQSRKPTHGHAHGFGVSCVRDRLQSLYGGEAFLTLHDAPHGPGTMATLELPLKPPSS
jgi:sensor histidine kinase YesM